MPAGAARPWPVHSAEARFVGKQDPQATTTLGGGSQPSSQHLEAVFLNAAGRTMDAMDKAAPETRYCGRLTPCCTTRLGPMPQSAQAAITSGVPCPHFARGRLRYADRLRRPRWRHGQP